MALDKKKLFWVLLFGVILKTKNAKQENIFQSFRGGGKYVETTPSISFELKQCRAYISDSHQPFLFTLAMSWLSWMQRAGRWLCHAARSERRRFANTAGSRDGLAGLVFTQRH